MTLLHSEIIPNICRKNGYILNKITENCSQIIHNKNSTYVYFFDFNCNENANSWIARDKPNTYNFLKANNIPAVEHVYIPFLNAKEQSLKYFKKHNQIVIKTTSGTCGRNVYFCSSAKSLESILNSLFSKGTPICISPFVKYEEEYRVVVLNNQAVLCYAKVLPYVIGDGSSTLNQLKNTKYPNLQISTSFNLNEIIPKNKKINLLWKHNLSNGAEILTKLNKNIIKEITSLALKTAKCLNLKICSVDIIKHNNQFKVLEINPGLMMENFYASSLKNKQKTIKIYNNLIKLCLNTQLYCE